MLRQAPADSCINRDPAGNLDLGLRSGSQELLPSKVQPFWLEAEEEKEEEFIRIHGYCRGTQGARC